jgi:hypothetical protein
MLARRHDFHLIEFETPLIFRKPSDPTLAGVWAILATAMDDIPD